MGAQVGWLRAKGLLLCFDTRYRYWCLDNRPAAALKLLPTMAASSLVSSGTDGQHRLSAPAHSALRPWFSQANASTD